MDFRKRLDDTGGIMLTLNVTLTWNHIKTLMFSTDP
jgi:hypothetical protein